ncbi:cupin domain-containing protein [Actinocorallia sp. A-T 12471]|uniref:cupin domain-containing protein n=1 Tax=Actinocorallia sp. A-T 12471 TaxID=3089813 RepID=UPI0029CB99CE|nr:cupin domain-containing protein [Actinocorallia sp. A-T 12471]MDX6740907.1 cupin domain-containing protein [Actinocorallia sp. A-T 12471]
MAIEQVQILVPGSGTPVVPPVADYDAASDGWTEVEHRAELTHGRSVAGAWTGEPGSVRISRWPYDEVCVVQSGRVAVEDTEGGRREFGPGDAFLVPAGFDGWWHTLEPTRKIFVGLAAE